MGGGRVAQALSVAADHGAGTLGGVVHGGQFGKQIAGKDDGVAVALTMQRPHDVTGRGAPAAYQVGESAGMQRLVDVGEQDPGAVRRQRAGGADDGRGPAQRVVAVVHRTRGETV